MPKGQYLRGPKNFGHSRNKNTGRFRVPHRFHHLTGAAWKRVYNYYWRKANPSYHSTYWHKTYKHLGVRRVKPTGIKWTYCPKTKESST